MNIVGLQLVLHEMKMYFRCLRRNCPVEGVFNCIGKSYAIKNAPLRMHTRALGRCCCRNRAQCGCPPADSLFFICAQNEKQTITFDLEENL